MGDHRCSFKAEIEMHGLKDDCNMWINWSPSERGGVDCRILEWIANFAERAMNKYYAEQEKYEFERTKTEREAAEKKEYERLKAKFEPH